MYRHCYFPNKVVFREDWRQSISCIYIVLSFLKVEGKVDCSHFYFSFGCYYKVQSGFNETEILLYSILATFHIKETKGLKLSVVHSLYTNTYLYDLVVIPYRHPTLCDGAESSYMFSYESSYHKGHAYHVWSKGPSIQRRCWKYVFLISQ